MNDEERTKDQLIEELTELRQRIDEMEASTGIKRSEGALRDSDDRLRILFESAPDVYYLNDMSGKIIDGNKAAEELTGYKRHELIGKNLLSSKLLSPSQIPKAAEILARNDLGRATGPDELTLIRKDGSRVVVEINTTPVKIKNQGLVLGIARDITVRKRAEETLQKVRDELEELVSERTAGLSDANELLNREISERKQAEEALQKARDELDELVGERTAELSNANELLEQEISERKQAEEALQKARDELDELVRERTAELSNANELLEREMSERKRADEALIEKEEKYRTILETVREGYYEVDIRGNLTFFNESFCEIWGYPRDELMGMNNRDYMDEENASKAFVVFNGVHTKGEPAEALDWEIIRKDGGRRRIEASVFLMKEAEGRPRGFRGIVRDVTERNLMASEKSFLQNIFDSSSDCIMTTDPHGTTTLTTPRVKDVLGYEQDEIIGKKMHFLYGEGIEDAKKIMNELSEKGELRNHETKLKRKDGNLIDIDLSASLLRDAKGEVIGTIGIFRDVSQKKKLEAQLQEARKLEAIGTLAGGIAHDFNNLLMGIQGNASLMLLDINSSHSHYEKLRNIEQHVQSGADLTKQLLGFARGGKYDVKATNLNDLVRESSEAFGRTRKEINIHKKYQEGIWTADVDRDQIEQVLSSLYVNSWQAMPGGGDLYLETENVVLNEQYYAESYGVEPGKYVKISVTDTGVGMDEATKQKVFEPFFTTKEMGRGTGLGLAAAHGIIRNHGGIITVHSEKGKGTTFNLYLPVSEKK